MRLSILTKLFLFLPALAFSAEDFTIYRARYRTADELADLARPLFAGKATFSAMNEKVVINANRQTTAAALKLFAELDQVAREYTLQVRLVARAEGEKSQVGLERGNVSLGKSGVKGTGAVRVKEENTVARAEVEQSLRLTEGSEGSLMLGDYWQPGGVFAKIRGGNARLVNLEIRQREPSANPSLQLQSKITLVPGQWQTIGSVKQSREEKSGGILRRGSASGGEDKLVQVRVLAERGN